MRRLHKVHGFTLIELMITLAVASLLIMLVAPSFQEMILLQRVRGVNAQLVTDLQFSRAEAVARVRYMYIDLNQDTNQSCYVVWFAVDDQASDRCDCTRGAGTACNAPNGTPYPGLQEVKTVSVPRSGGIQLAWPASQDTGFAYDFVTGGLLSHPTDQALQPMALLTIHAQADSVRRLTTQIGQSGRPRVCGTSSENVQKMQVPSC
jgi:prepilin-type N-terminal cleavage/methylation domain-containing protein